MIEYYTVENTGWSNGVSWFTINANRYDSRRFKTFDEARAYITEHHWGDSKVEWRICHHTVTRKTENDRLIEQLHSGRYVYIDAEKLD